MTDKEGRYGIDIYQNGCVAQSLRGLSRKEAMAAFIGHATLLDCYTELIVDGERMTMQRAKAHFGLDKRRGGLFAK